LSAVSVCVVLSSLTTVITEPVFTGIGFGEKEKFLMTTVSGLAADPVDELWSEDTKLVSTTAITATAGTIATSSHVGPCG
jgi:hypothetical protein